MMTMTCYKNKTYICLNYNLKCVSTGLFLDIFVIYKYFFYNKKKKKTHFLSKYFVIKNLNKINNVDWQFFFMFSIKKKILNA